MFTASAGEKRFVYIYKIRSISIIRGFGGEPTIPLFSFRQSMLLVVDLLNWGIKVRRNAASKTCVTAYPVPGTIYCGQRKDSFQVTPANAEG